MAGIFSKGNSFEVRSIYYDLQIKAILIVMVSKRDLSNVNQIDCEYWKACFQYVKARLEIGHILENNHYCFCMNCHKKRNDLNKYTRGNPPKVYELPLGYAGFAVALNNQTGQKTGYLFNNWHNSFHGTTEKNFNKISKCGMSLYKPDDITPIGNQVVIRVEEGRIQRDHIRTCPYTNKKIDFKVKKIFSSPCICYADQYAKISQWQNNNYKIVLQTRVINSEDCVVVGPETVNSTKAPPICRNGQENAQLEYMVQSRENIIITRLLIKKF